MAGNRASTSRVKSSGKRSFSSHTSGNLKQSSILDLFQPIGKSKKSRASNDVEPGMTMARTEPIVHIGGQVEEGKHFVDETFEPGCALETSEVFSDLHSLQGVEDDVKLGSDWDKKADRLLQKHFGYSGLKSFQKEVLSVWLAHQDCLVLAATGSGPLQKLAENRGIALFAIDEVHCVSKWGHDFRPDYRRLSVLRKNFSVSSLKFLKYDIPIMALTATATINVRDDILKALHMSTNAKVVLTSFFRPNLQFSVKHSRTTSLKSYGIDFQELVQEYSSKRTTEQRHPVGIVTTDMEDAFECTSSTTTESWDADDDEVDDDINSHNENNTTCSTEKQLSVEFLEDDYDDIQTANDFDVSCGEFCAQSLVNEYKHNKPTELPRLRPKADEIRQVGCAILEQGPTIIYVPTRKQTISVAKYLSAKGVKAEPYNAGLPKSHLRRVHKEFQENALDIVVATIAFGMGIDKLNVRRIIHYGWPQSLEAYYQEAGRAGRDGKLADCILYADLSKIPTLLPNKRSDVQKKQAYKMLSDCFRYGMNTSICRAKILVEYFGENFREERCMACDVCRNGPPVMQDVKEEAHIFLHVIAAHHNQQKFGENSYDDYFGCETMQYRSSEKPNLRTCVAKIREQSQKFLAIDQIWWRGLARILQDKGFIGEGSDVIGVQIKFPEPTEKGLRFLECSMEQDLFVYPEADMLLSKTLAENSFSSFSWGKGWADPEIRRQRLGRKRTGRKPRKPRQKSRRKPDLKTVRGRLTAKLSKQKR